MTGSVTMLFSATALAAMTALPSAALADDYQINNDNIATCSGNGNAQASRGELATPLANQFWSRMGCGHRDDAFELLESAPSAPIDMLPNAYAPSPTSLTICYYASFPYGPEYHNPTSDTRDGVPTGEMTVRHGFYGFDLGAFQKIQSAMLGSCAPNIG